MEAIRHGMTTSATRLTLIRHGETLWNRERRMQAGDHGLAVIQAPIRSRPVRSRNRIHAAAPSRSKILPSLSPSVAAVNGLMT